METLNFESKNHKQINIVLVEKENKYVLNHERLNLCDDVLKQYQFDFATMDLEGSRLENFNPKPLIWILGTCTVPAYGIDMPEYARNYVVQEIDDLKEQVHELEEEYEKMDKNTFKAENLESWIEMLKGDIQDKETGLETEVKPKWIAKRIFDIAARFDGEDVLVLHFTPKKLFDVVKGFLEEFDGVTVAVLDLDKKVVVPSLVQ